MNPTRVLLGIAIGCACLALAGSARADGATPAPAPRVIAARSGAPAATASPVRTEAAPWWPIARMVAGYGLASPGVAHEIQPWVLAPDEQTRALEFRGAFPNPFHAETAIRWTLPVSAHVSLRLYDVAGKLVRTLVDAQLPPGDHSAMLIAGEMHSRVYFAVLRTGGVQVSRSVVLAR